MERAHQFKAIKVNLTLTNETIQVRFKAFECYAITVRMLSVLRIIFLNFILVNGIINYRFF